MPLLSSPIDGAPMRQINRYGIEIDVCPTTGGIWLDKGELEKLMALLREEEQQQVPHQAVRQAVHQAPQHTVIHDYDYEKRHSKKYYDDDHHHGHYSSHHKKNKLSRVMDIFDF